MTSLALLLFQSPTPLQTAAPPEKLPAWLTLIYISGIAGQTVGAGGATGAIPASHAEARFRVNVDRGFPVKS